MFCKQIKVKDDSGWYEIYSDQHLPFPLSDQQIRINKVCTCVSIDIGIKNFAIRIEDRYINRSVPKIFEKIDFREKESGTTSINPDVIRNLSNFLDSLMHIIELADIIVIERQLAVNVKSSALFNMVIGYFVSRESRLPNTVICAVNPKLKTYMFKPGKLSKVEVKKWAIEKALEILLNYQDIWSWNMIIAHKGKSKTKADDLSDTVVQLEALKMLFS